MLFVVEKSKYHRLKPVVYKHHRRGATTPNRSAIRTRSATESACIFNTTCARCALIVRSLVPELLGDLFVEGSACHQGKNFSGAFSSAVIETLRQALCRSRNCLIERREVTDRQVIQPGSDKPAEESFQSPLLSFCGLSRS